MVGRISWEELEEEEVVVSTVALSRFLRLPHRLAPEVAAAAADSRAEVAPAAAAVAAVVATAATVAAD